MRLRYRFVGRIGASLVWESTTRLPGDSRVERISCSATWFYGQMVQP